MSKGSDFAFPISNPNFPGMTLRDYFAGQLMIERTHGISMIPAQSNAEKYPGAKALAKFCYAVADAMLEERG